MSKKEGSILTKEGWISRKEGRTPRKDFKEGRIKEGDFPRNNIEKGWISGKQDIKVGLITRKERYQCSKDINEAGISRNDGNKQRGKVCD